MLVNSNQIADALLEIQINKCQRWLSRLYLPQTQIKHSRRRTQTNWKNFDSRGCTFHHSSEVCR